MMSDYIIGLTGGIGSGKTTVANIFSEFGVELIDADIIARDIVKKGSPALIAIIAYFGEKFIQNDGQLNRSLLRKHIFANNSDKLWLNNLLHPLIREQIVTQIKASSSPYCIIVAPLLVENKLNPLVDRVLVVDVKESTQLARTTERDNNVKEQVQAIINSQVSRQVRQDNADDILNNDDCTMDKLKVSVTQLHQKYLAYAEQKTLLNKK
jgi:dephospho-CoA kinase